MEENMDMGTIEDGEYVENSEIVIRETGEILEHDPKFSSFEEQARENAKRMRSNFSESIALVAEAYQYELWRHLTSEDTGQPFKSLQEYCMANFSIGQSMARRYIQGARDFYIPLSAVAVEGTHIDIKAQDIAKLGSGGLQEVVEEVKEGVEEDPDIDIEALIQQKLEGANERREHNLAAKKAESSGGGSSDDWGDYGRDFDEYPESDASGPVGHYLDDEGYEKPVPVVKSKDSSAGRVEPKSNGFIDDGEIALTREEHEALNAAKSSSKEGEGGLNTVTSPGNSLYKIEDDLLSEVVGDVAAYRDGAALDSLPRETRRLVRALITISEADMSEIGKTLEFDTRGVVKNMDVAASNLLQLRSILATQPWVVSRL